MIGGHSVQDDQEHVGRTRCRQRPRLFTPFLEPISGPDRSRQQRNEPGQDREAQSNAPSKPRGMSLQHRDQPCGDSQHQDQPGRAVDSRKDGPEEWQQGQGAEQPGGDSAAGTRPNPGRQRQDQAEHEEDQEVRQGGHPDEMAAHPVELDEVHGVLAQHDGPDLEQPGDQAAPERQDQDMMGAQNAGAGARRRRGRRTDLLGERRRTVHRHEPAHLATGSEVFGSPSEQRGWSGGESGHQDRLGSVVRGGRRLPGDLRSGRRRGLETRASAPRAQR